MVGKRAEAEEISKCIGSLGLTGSVPGWFYVMEAAKILGSSYMELNEHPEKLQLMRMAFTYKRGTQDGEYLVQVNPTAVAEAKTRQKAIQDAWK